MLNKGMKKIALTVLTFCMLCSLFQQMPLYVKAGSVSYAPYNGVDFYNAGLSPQRVAALDKAKKMVCIKWTAIENFPTWKSSSGAYNYAVASDGTSSNSFVKGKTYTGIPYSMTDHTFDDNKWKNYVENNSITASNMTGSFYSDAKDTTKHGVDCSYFVYSAIGSAVGFQGFNYQATADMLNSSYYTKLKYKEEMLPGDLFLKNGHVMMFVGKSGSSYAVFEADANDSKCSYNVYSENALRSYYPYRFNGFGSDPQTCTCSEAYAGTYRCTTERVALTIRDQHGTNGNKIGSIPSGAEVYVSKANGSWAHVEYNGVSGYATMNYLAKKENAPILQLPDRLTISEGTYAIRARKNSGFSLSIFDNSNLNGANVHLWQYNQSNDYAQFLFTYLGNGLYSIENCGSGRYLDVSEYGLGDDVVQYRNGGVADNEKWYVVDSDDSYYLVPYCKKTKAIDIDNGVMNNGTNIHLWDQTRGDTQQLVLTKVNKAGQLKLPSFATISDGIYAIRAAANTNYAVGCVNKNDNGTNVELRLFNEDADYQAFRFSYIGDGLYSIENYGSNKYLDVSDYGQGDNTVLYRNGAVADNEKWYVVQENDVFYLVPYCKNTKALDINNGSMSSGTNIQIYDQTRGAPQQFVLTKLNKTKNTLPLPSLATIDNGIYSICPTKNISYAIGIDNDSNNNGANAQLWQYSGTNNYEKFKFNYLGGGLYSIENIGSGKFLDVSDYGLGGGVVQYRNGNPTANEKWYVIEADGSFYLVPFCQPTMALDFDNGIMENGTDVHLWSQTRGDTQRITLISYNATSKLELPGSRTINDGIYAIKAAKNTGFSLSIDNDSNNNGANVHLWQYDSSNDYEAFSFTHLGNGLYSIENVGSGKFLDVSEYGLGEDVVQYRNGNVANNEKWYVIPKDNGYYLVPYCKINKALDIDNGTMSNGTNIHLWDQTRGDTQLLVLTERKKSLITKITDMFFNLRNNTYGLTVVGSSNSALSEDSDYTIDELNVNNDGTIDVTITGINNYEGTVSATLDVAPSELVTVSYNANGGQSDTTNKTVQLNSEYGELPVPVREGYRFGGWFTTIDGNEQITNDTIVCQSENHTLYARWISNTYYVKYDGNGADAGTMPVQALSYDSEENLPENQFIKSGYYFAGWNTASDGSGSSISDQDEVCNLSDENEAVVTLYAMWESSSHSVTYNANGGSNAPSGQTKEYGVDLKLSTSVPVRDGYYFQGWATSPSGEAVYSQGAMYTEEADLTLYAVWQYGENRIAYVIDNIEVSGDKLHIYGWAYDRTSTNSQLKIEIMHTKDNTVSQAFTKTNSHRVDVNAAFGIEGLHGIDYTVSTGFAGTYDLKILAGFADNSHQVVIYSGKVTYIPEYTISYDANGGNEAPENQIKKHSVDLVLDRMTPIRKGYVFEGWATSSDGEPVYMPGDVYTENKESVLYAVWKHDPAMTVYLPANTTIIGEECFYNDTSFVHVVIPEGCTTIDKKAFANCSSLETVRIPNTVVTIADDAFSGTNNVVIIVQSGSNSITDYADRHGITWITE